MQDTARIHHLRPDGRRVAANREPHLDGPVPANEDSWLDTRAFDQDMRALFSEEDLAAMRHPADRNTLDWGPVDDAHDRKPQGLARIGVVALALYAATAVGVGLYFVVDPFGSGEAEAPVTTAMAAQATEVAPILATPPAPPPPPSVAPVQSPASAPVQARSEPAPSPQTAVAAGPAVPAWIEQPAPVSADLSPAGPPAAAPKPAEVLAQVSAEVPAAQPNPVKPKASVVLTPGQAAAHLARASTLLETGQIPAARAVLLLLAEQGNTEANYRYGRTFDPKVLQAMGAVGIRGDVETARKYYGLAAAAGHSAAREALQNL